MTGKNNSVKNIYLFFISILFVYIVLFEFILPVNKLIPRPSLVTDSFIHIWSDYSLVYAISASLTVIYSMMVLVFALIYLGSSFLLKILVEYKESIVTLRLFRFVPVFALSVFFAFWFSDRLLGEFIFAFLAIIFLLVKMLFKESNSTREEYLTVARNLDLPMKDIYSKILWKSSLPAISGSFQKSHSYIWTIILLFEFISNYSGIGSIYRQALAYNDFTALFTITILVTILIWTGNYLLGLIKNKFIPWTDL